MPGRETFQFVWWGWSDWGLALVRFNIAETDWAYIYRWILRVGPFEVRRWSTLKAPQRQEAVDAKP